MFNLQKISDVEITTIELFKTFLKFKSSSQNLLSDKCNNRHWHLHFKDAATDVPFSHHC